MKELSIEERARRYDEAIEKAKGVIEQNPLMEYLRKGIEYIFPELKESEDEKIRKGIIRNLEYLMDRAEGFVKDELKERIAWLEKQGEKGANGNEREIPFSEQKPADNAEPKFHKGDWVVYCNDDVDLITGVEENGYCINNGGYIPFVCENEMRLWDITDAKVGDVLVSESTCGLGTWYCIFKSLDGDESMTVYCYLARDGRFETKKELCFDKDPYSTKPATKEQRDLLFQKMHEAGYEWDAEKKELRKIEQRHSWSEEDEEIHRKCICAMRASACGFPEEEKFVEQVDNWLKALKERYTWKPSDEQIDAIDYVKNFDYGGYKDMLVSLYYDLKKLKE